MKLKPIGLGKKKKYNKKIMGKGILDSIKKGVKTVQSWKLAQKGLNAIQDNKLIRDTLEKTGVLRPLTQVLVKGRELGFGARRRKTKGKGFFQDVYKGIKSGISKVTNVSDNLKKLGIARNLNKVIPYAQKASMFIPKYGQAVSSVIEGAKPVLNKLQDLGYGRKRKIKARGFMNKISSIQDINNNAYEMASKFAPKEFKVANNLLQMARNRK